MNANEIQDNNKDIKSKNKRNPKLISNKEIKENRKINNKNNLTRSNEKEKNRNNSTRNKKNLNKKKDKDNSLLFSITHENNINLEGSLVKTKKSNNPLIKKISNYIGYEEEEVDDDEEEPQEVNNENNEDDYYDKKLFKSSYLEKNKYKKILKLSPDKKRDSKISKMEKNNSNQNSNYISIRKVSNDINYDEQINKYNEMLFYREEEKFMERQKMLEMQKNHLKEELRKINDNKFFLNKYKKPNQIKSNIITKNSKNISIKSSIEKEHKQKIKLIQKNKNKSTENIIFNNEESFNNDNKLIIDLKELQRNPINSNNNLMFEAQVSSPISINTRAKAEPLKFIADYYISKDILNNSSNHNKSKGKINKNNNSKNKIKHEKNKSKNATVFDIIKAINNSKSSNLNNVNNDLEKQLSKFKGKIINGNISPHSRNKNKNNNMDNTKNDSSTKKSSKQNMRYKSDNNSISSTSRIKKSNRKIKYNNNQNYQKEKYSMNNKFKNKITNNSISNPDAYYNSDLTSFRKKPHKKAISLNKKNKKEFLAQSQKSVKTKIFIKNKLNNSKSKRYNSSMNINGIENNNYDDKYILYNNTTSNENYPNYFYTSNSSTKRLRRFKNNSMSRSTERKYY